MPDTTSLARSGAAEDGLERGRVRLKACEQALALIELLQRGIDAGSFLPEIRREAQLLAFRLIELLRAGR